MRHYSFFSPFFCFEKKFLTLSLSRDRCPHVIFIYIYIRYAFYSILYKFNDSRKILNFIRNLFFLSLICNLFRYKKKFFLLLQLFITILVSGFPYIGIHMLLRNRIPCDLWYIPLMGSHITIHIMFYCLCLL